MNKDIKILVVDDMGTVLKLETSMLNGLGFHNIDIAENGEEAWQKIQKEASYEVPYELIICDWNMPKMNGIELLDKIRADSSLKKTPFLMVTSEKMDSSIEFADEHGVSEYIIKPFNAELLRKKISRIV